MPLKPTHRHSQILRTGTSLVTRVSAVWRGLLAGLTAASLAGLGLGLLILGLPGFAQGITAGGARIDNIASVTYQVGAATFTQNSNQASLLTRTSALIEFFQHAPAASQATPLLVPPTVYSTSAGAAGPYAPLPLLPTGLANPLPLLPAEVFHVGEPIFIRLTDLDQNLDPQLAETVLVRVSSAQTGDGEWLRLTEMGTDSGVFLGYLPSTGGPAAAADGALSVSTASRLSADYTDVFDGTDSSIDAALVDPLGIVFDDRTGAPLDNVSISLVDALSGQPATVFGDDGVSTYPSTLTTGGSATDSSGRLYQFPPGGYRFPLIPPGSYRLVVIPPAGYLLPSKVPTAQLENLPGGPYAIVTGSRGEAFRIEAGPAVRIDIPATAQTDGLWVEKSAGKPVVGIGDFLPYRLRVQNNHPTVAAREVVVSDLLPPGFRFQGGSARIDGLRGNEPQLSEGGRRLTIALGDLAAGVSRELTYVVEVAAGARVGRATNAASARDQLGSLSNTATATVQVREDFFRSKAIILGRVLVGGCELDDTKKAGLAGVRIYLEDGTYVVTDKDGLYHIEGVEPGVHVLQLDLDSLPKGYQLLPCEANGRFAGRAYSQFVDLQGSTLWRADFYADRTPAAQGTLGLELNSSMAGQRISYRLPLHGERVALTNLRLTLVLPPGTSYLPGSSRRDGQPMADPETQLGTLTYRLGDVPAQWASELALQVEWAGDGPATELQAKALLTFDAPAARNQRTPLAENTLRPVVKNIGERLPDFVLRPQFATRSDELTAADRRQLDDLARKLKQLEVVAVSAVGHTDNLRIAPENRQFFADNQALSEARAKSVVRYLGEALQLPPGSIVLRGEGERQPLADNGSEAGRAQNRRVELRVQTRQPLPALQQAGQSEDRSGAKTVATQGAEPAQPPAKREPDPAVKEEVQVMPDFAADWLLQAPPATRWLWPGEDFVPAMPSLDLAIQHQRGEQLSLSLNGAAVPGVNFDGSKARPDGQVAVSKWRGVDLREGDNLLEVNVRDASGQLRQTLQRTIYYVNLPARAELVPEQSRLVADGVTTPMLALKLTDRLGNPVRAGLYGDYQVLPPYQPAVEQPDRNTGAEPRGGTAQARYRVGPGGIAQLQLAPTVQSGQVRVELPLAEGPQQLKAWLKPSMRDWILVGFAQGTLGYNTLAEKVESAAKVIAEEGYYEDGQVKFFAKGTIKGEWLLTLAYDSDKPSRDGETLKQIIDPDAYYPVYGDGTAQNYEAASARSLYVKLEREQFYALFGDFDTGLTVTELSRYSRSLNGVKSEWKTGHFEYNAFASDTRQAFVKDELRGDGTSGLYRLTQRRLVLNSEKITLETRDRFRSELVLKSEELHRHLDYEIDYDDGSLFFKRPVPSKDERFNPNYIVVRYEVRSTEDSNLNYGARAAVKGLGERVEIGATHVHEDRGAEQGDLYGLDASLKVNQTTRVRVEAATTENDQGSSVREGDAYLAEVEHRSKRLAGSLYYREQQAGFGLGQQNGSETGTRKYGLEAGYLLNDKLTLAGEAFRQQNLATAAEREVVEARTVYQAERYGYELGLRQATDQFDHGDQRRSDQLLTGLRWWSPERRLALRADNELTLGGRGENGDYPNRLLLGADYLFNRQLTVFGEQEFTWSADERAEQSRIGLKARPWDGGTLHSALGQQQMEEGRRTFALFGLYQVRQLSERLSLDFGLDRNQTLKDQGVPRPNFDVPAATGIGEEFTAVSLGSTYRMQQWTWWNRLETRQGESQDKYGVVSSIVGEPRERLALSARLEFFLVSATAGGSDSTDLNLRLGLAYRPTESRWILLDRLDYYQDRESGSLDHLRSWRLVNNFNANYRPSRKIQHSVYFGLKYVQDTLAGTRYSGTTHLLGYETRYNFSKRWDVGLQASSLQSWNSDQVDYSVGASLGYLVMTNAWASLGYNLVGFRDDDFSAANYTAQGPYVRFRLKFDQDTVRSLAAGLNSN